MALPAHITLYREFVATRWRAYEKAVAARGTGFLVQKLRELYLTALRVYLEKLDLHASNLSGLSGPASSLGHQEEEEVREERQWVMAEIERLAAHADGD